MYAADQRMLVFWARIINAEDKQLKKSLCQITYKADNQGELESSWIQRVIYLLADCQLYHHWLEQSIPLNLREMWKR